MVSSVLRQRRAGGPQDTARRSSDKSISTAATSGVSLFDICRFFGFYVAVELISIAILSTSGFSRRAVIYITSSIGGLCHSTMSLYFTLPQLIARPYVYNSRNSKASINCFSSTIAYFCMDSAYCFFCEYPGWELFVGHHIASAIAVLLCSVYGFGDMALVVWYVIGESTNQLQNAYLIMEQLGLEDSWLSPLAASLSSPTRAAFFLFFVVVRVVVSPPVFLHFFFTYILPPSGGYHAKSGVYTLPHWVRLVWSVLIGGILVGSFSFINNNLHFLEPLHSILPSALLSLMKP